MNRKPADERAFLFLAGGGMLRRVANAFMGTTGMLVRLDHNSRKADGIGSAFLCHEAGYMLTCAHTFRLTDQLGVALPATQSDGFMPMQSEHAEVVLAQVAQYDAEHDVALLKLAPGTRTNFPSDAFLPEHEAEIGASVAYVGFPFPNQGQHARHIGQSIISSKVLSPNGTRQFQLDAMIHAGNSGGPVIDVAKARIMGIVSGRFSPVGVGGIRMMMNGQTIGSESAIGYAISISYGIDLLRAEGLHV